MLKIFDSYGEIKDIAVAILCRNNEKYLIDIFPFFEQLEKIYDVNFQFIFLENGSKDMTCKVINSFLKKRKGLLAHPHNPEALDKLSRTEKMSTLRNQLKAIITPNFQWLMLLDTDVYFEFSVLKNLSHHLALDPNLGMICANGIEVIKKSGFRKYKKRFRQFKDEINLQKEITFLTQYHYYDTFAFRDINGNNYWPNCNFIKCQKCTNTLKDSLSKSHLQYVSSAFGGIALIHEKILSDPLVLWRGTNHNNNIECEHVWFCDSILRNTKYSIGIARDVECYWVVP